MWLAETIVSNIKMYEWLLRFHAYNAYRSEKRLLQNLKYLFGNIYSIEKS